MFNRSLKVSLTKEKKPQLDQPVTTPTDYAAIATDLGKKVLIGTVIVLAAYISLDTGRQVIVNNVIPK